MEKKSPALERCKPAVWLALLSKRFEVAAQQLGLRWMHSMFNDKHGICSSAHFRSLASVIEVITADVIPPESRMGRVIHATIAWYWACRAKSFTAADLDTKDWHKSAMKKKKCGLPKRRALLLPKFHRAIKHTVDYVRRFGPMEYLTTETSESLHKPLKTFFNVCVSLLCCALCWPHA